ncbi:hypothetical protein [Neolewinella agarilytica]|uniref:Uncharacterized protein n=1 Tax=Neolewinella agarilytica TaxID=478744 RepID=A0A1H9P8F6_9BACT|nr:hypothetical protein [Neolewinella agarilytica]SER44498.1 hypothetical protein SAMN05444359_1445 [Neolewinella agarilytica]
MLILLLGLVLLVAVGFFFIIPILLNRKDEKPTDVLDLDNFPKVREKEPLTRDDSEDMMV